MAQKLANGFPVFFNFSWDTTGSYSDYRDINTVKIAPGFSEKVRSQIIYKSDLRFDISIGHSESDLYYVVAWVEVYNIIKLKEYNNEHQSVSQ